MTVPKNPEESLLMQRAGLAMVVVFIATMVGFVVVALFSAPTTGWGPAVIFLGLIGAFTLLVLAVLQPILAAHTDFRRHALGDSAHQCQCRDCGRAFVPATDSLIGPPNAKTSPQQRSAVARSMLRMSPIAGLVLFLSLIVAVIITASGWGVGTEPWLIFFLAVFDIFVGIGILVVVLVARAQRDATDREMARHSPQHGCTCQWCGRESTTPRWPTGS